MPGNDKLAVALPSKNYDLLELSDLIMLWMFLGINKKKNHEAENPFKMPADTDIFLLREKEKQAKLKVILNKYL